MAHIRMPRKAVRAVAFHLPQFHPVPENDAWWGKGFTEWRNVAKAQPKFPGHYQPHLPADLGFYDLRLPEVREAQADMARSYGIDGFCYYHYWFNGRRILERPFQEILATGRPDFPFMLCWANENWTRVWDGGAKDILLQQNYSAEDDRAHIASLLPAFRDERYIRIDGKPFFAVYRAELLPDPLCTTATWREAARKAGVGDLYLARVESYNSVQNGIRGRDLGFDADIEFAPFSWQIGGIQYRDALARMMARTGLLPKGLIDNHVISYDAMVQGMLKREEPESVRFPCVTPSWDNSPRRQRGANIFVDSTPDKYERWLAQAVVRAQRRARTDDERIVFINAWNEWAEGNHLEPDLKWGTAYLLATQRALHQQSPARQPELDPGRNSTVRHGLAKAAYWQLLESIKAQRRNLRFLGKK